MDSLKSLTAVLDKKQQNEFRSKLRKESRRGEAKELQLYDLLLKGEVENPGEILYKSKGEAAYHTLRKRLSQRLVDFIVLKRMEGDKTSSGSIMGLISLSEYLFEQGLEEQAWLYIRKAEERAVDGDHFDLLNSIYLHQIEHYHPACGEDINSIIERKQKNKALQDEDERVTIACSLIRNELRKIVVEGREVDFEGITRLILTSYNLNNAIIERPKVLFNILTIARSTILAKKDFHSFEPYIISKYAEVLGKHGFTRKDHFYQLSILYMIAHVLYRNRKFTEASEYMAQMNEVMGLHGGNHIRFFYSRYVTLLAAIKSYSNQLDDAIALLEDAINTYPDRFGPRDKAKLKLNLSIYYFQMGDFSRAIRTNVSIGKTDKWFERNLGKEWIFKRNLMEIIAQMEAGNIETALNMIRSFERRFGHLFTHPLYKRAKTFIELIKKMIQDPINFLDEDFTSKIEKQLIVVPEEQEDLQAMAFYAWVKAKVQNRGYYEVLLETVSG